MAYKTVRRNYYDDTGKLTHYTTHRAQEGYTVRGGPQKDRFGKKFSEEEFKPSLRGNLARGMAPAAVTAGLGGLSGVKGGLGQGIGAMATAGANVAGQHLQAYHPDSKLAAVGTSALSTGTDKMSGAYNKELNRTGSGAAALKAGALAGAQGVLQGAIGSVPGGKSIAGGLGQAMGGFMSGGLKGGLTGLVRGILTSPTLSSDMGKMFQGSKASDYNEGTWGNNMSNIEDENKLDDAAAAAKLKAENERRELAGLPPKADPNAEKEKEGQQGAAEGANPAEPAAAAGANAGEAGANPAAAGEGGANAGEAGANAGEAGEGAEANPDAPEGGANAPAAEGGLGAPQGGAPPREEEARQAAGANAGEGGANAGEEAGANPAPAQPAAEGQQPQPQGAPGVGGVQAQGAPQQQVPQQAAAAGAGEGAAVGGGMQVAPPLAQPSPQGQANQRGASLQEPFDYDNSTTAQINENTQQILNSKTHESELMTPTERTEIEEEARRRNAEFAHTRDHMHTSFYMNNPRFPEMKGKYVRPFGEAEYDAMPEQRNNFDNPPKGAIKEDANGIPYIKTPFGPLQAYDKDNPKAENANKYKELLKKMSINMQSGNEIEARATYEQLSRMQRGIHLNDTERVKEAGGTFKSLKDTITNEVSDDSKSISDVDGTLKKAQEAYFSLPERLRDKEHQGTSLREEMRMIEAIARRGEKDKGGRLSDAFDVMGGTGYKDDYEPKTAREPLHDGRYIFSRQSHRERGNDALIEGTNVGAAIGAPAAAAARPAPADEGNPYDVNRIEIPDFNFFGGMFG